MKFFLYLSFWVVFQANLFAQDCNTDIIINGGVNVSCNGGNDGAVDIDIIAEGVACSSNYVVLNEIMYRAPLNNGDDELTGEMVELIAPPGTNIGCYVLTDGDWTITIPPNTVVPADGFFTMGNDSVYGAGTFDLDVENCNCYTEGSLGGALLIFTDGGEYAALFDGTGTFIDGLIYGSPSQNNQPPLGASATSAGVIQTAGLPGCPQSIQIPQNGYETHSGGAGVGTSLIRDPDGSGSWTTQSNGSINDCNAPIVITYTVVWNNGDSTEDLTGVGAGTYTVIAASNLGCSDTATVTITEPAPIGTQLNITPENCNIQSGSIEMQTSGGTPAYTFEWSTGANTENVSGLFAGNYTVTITDNNGCTFTQEIIVPNTVALSAQDSVSDALCFKTPSGNAFAQVSGGTPPYSFLWSDGATTQDNIGVLAGNYVLTVTDANGCIFVLTADVINEPEPLVLSIDSLANALCSYSDEGAIEASASGSVPPYNFSWSTGDSDTLVTDLFSGTYTLTLTDANGCWADTTLTITAPTPIKAHIASTDSIIGCDAVADANLYINSVGGAAFFAYQWSNGSSDSVLTGLGAGAYSLTVTDANGCTATDDFVIDSLETSAVSASLSATQEIHFQYVMLGNTAQLFVQNPQAGLSYHWSVSPNAGISDSSAINTVLTASSAGVYNIMLTAISADSCIATDSLQIEVIAPFLGMPDAFTPNGDGLNDVFRPVQLLAKFVTNFKIYNRFGDCVYDGNEGWDGTLGNQPQPRDAYVYVITYQLPFDAAPSVLRGEFMLIR